MRVFASLQKPREAAFEDADARYSRSKDEITRIIYTTKSHATSSESGESCEHNDDFCKWPSASDSR